MMRVKTDAKRQEILSLASEIFREAGYERASMAMIAERIGGSKGTLYGYFPSKEDLFAAVMLHAMDDQAGQLLNIFDTATDDPRATLVHFCDAYAEFVLLPDVVAYIRAGIIGDGHTGLGKVLYERGPKAGWSRVAEFIADAVHAGKLRRVDPWLAALQLKGLVETGLLEPALYGASPLFERGVISRSAVDVFLRAYQV